MKEERLLSSDYDRVADAATPNLVGAGAAFVPIFTASAYPPDAAADMDETYQNIFSQLYLSDEE